MLAFSVAAYAQSKAPAKGQNAGTKLLRGAANVVGCLLELPKQIYLTSKEDNLYIGFTYGTVKGLAYGVYRGVVGLLETVTFAFPPYGKVLVEPEYVSEGW
jgi:putative exosortase-associated protein (TIGR04073 family)